MSGINTDIREALADLAHKQWSGWMDYLFSVSKYNGDGSVTIPKYYVDRWKRQVNTDYRDLSEEEKESDRKEADRALAVIDDMHIMMCRLRIV